ncbi:MAG: MerR family transcriptional regulator [Candidatus Levyibacteriota bacterium]
MKKSLVTVKEAAELFGVSIQTIRRWDKTGRLKAVRHPMNNYRLYSLVKLQVIVKELNRI